MADAEGSLLEFRPLRIALEADETLAARRSLLPEAVDLLVGNLAGLSMGTDCGAGVRLRSDRRAPLSGAFSVPFAPKRSFDPEAAALAGKRGRHAGPGAAGRGPGSRRLVAAGETPPAR